MINIFDNLIKGKKVVQYSKGTLITHNPPKLSRKEKEKLSQERKKRATTKKKTFTQMNVNGE